MSHGLTWLPLNLFLLAALLFGEGSHADTVRIAHCLAGCPLGAPADNDVVIRSIYALSFNHRTRVADWVAYMVTPATIGIASNLSRTPVPDPYIPDALTEADYENAGAAAGVERSLFVPLVSFAGTPYWREVNFLTNMVPRNPELSRGSWYGLEWAVRNLANRAGEVYVLTGPIFDPAAPMPALPTGTPHQIPSGFYMVLAVAGGRVSAFRFDQQQAFHVHHCERRVNLEEIELATGLDLFPEAEQWPAGNLDQQLGCQ
ncbi:MAG: hypothetical protein RLZZ385_2801 [Pseudomonadota bacterium]|jgi:endonuclease G